jgi:Na+/H+ antiporter NhaD/arsenite permease-like protein
MVKVIRDKVAEEVVLVVALLVSAITSFYVKPNLGSIDENVILALFNLMLLSLAFEKYQLLEYMSIRLIRKGKSLRRIGAILISISAVLGMLITNDVALLTIVPLTLILSSKANFDPFKIIVFETAAANIGSSLTPFGNPQNLYLFNYYQLKFTDFIQLTFPVVICGMLLLYLVNSRQSKNQIDTQIKDILLVDKNKIIYYVFLFVIVILSILNYFEIKMVTVVCMISFLLLDRKLIKKVDYFLLFTFVCFFIAVDNFTRIESIKVFLNSLLSTDKSTFFVSIGLSQFISNVPSAILLSGFTYYKKALILGVNVGGIGTMVASLANLISFKLYTKKYDGSRYKKYFYTLNIYVLLLLVIFVYFF